MDVNATLKMNDMVKNLTKHGIISDSHEAIEMASKMYHVEKKEEPENQKQLEENTDNSDKLRQELKTLVDKRLQYFLEKQSSAMYKEFQELWTKMNQLGPHFENKLAQLKQEMNQISIQQEQKEIPKKVESKSENSHPRSGNFNESDVSVEKVFYFGEK